MNKKEKKIQKEIKNAIIDRNFWRDIVYNPIKRKRFLKIYKNLK